MENNTDILPNPVGRPPLYKTSEELQIKINEFFDSKPYGKITITGLVRFLGFCNRQSFYDLESKEEFSYTIKSARNRLEETYEGLLQDGLGAGAIFALKNFGWKDNSGIELSNPDGSALIPPTIIFESHAKKVEENASGSLPENG